MVSRFFDKFGALGPSMLAIGAAAIISMFVLQGCDFGDVFRVDVPQQMRADVQRDTGQIVPARVSYNDGESLIELYLRETARIIEDRQAVALEFSQEMDDGAARIAFASSLFNDSLTIIASGAEASGTPWGSLLGGLLIGGGGFLTGSRTANRKWEEKVASYNKAQKESRASA